MPTPKVKQIKIGKQKTILKATIWSRKDLPLIKGGFKNWAGLVRTIKKLGGRITNFPERLSEPIFCIFTKSVQVNNLSGLKKGGVDCYNFKTKKTQQVKASANPNSPSSFGPYSNFDEVHWLVFRENKRVFTGEFVIYKIPKKLIVNHPNFKRNAPAGKRPRFKLIDIVRKKNIKPYFKGRI